jgi:uncharacterized protein YbjT (DUF2867 family)
MPQNILVIGATGYLGGVLARHFIGEGHQVSGSARSKEAGDSLGAAGIMPVFGDLDAAMAPVLDAARDADVVVYTAQVDFEREPVVMARLCEALDVSGGVLS